MNRHDILLEDFKDTLGSPERRCPSTSKLDSFTEFYQRTSLASGLKLTYDWYIENMDNYYDSIDIQVSRAGGGSLEAAFLNIPQLLVPYKHGTTSQHQLLNAQFLEEKGAAKIITSYEELKTMLNSYLDDELSKLEFNIKAGNDHIGKVLINEIN